MIKTPCCRDDSCLAIPLGKFVPFAILRSYLQPNVEWQMNCIFNGGPRQENIPWKSLTYGNISCCHWTEYIFLTVQAVWHVN